MFEVGKHYRHKTLRSGPASECLFVGEQLVLFKRVDTSIEWTTSSGALANYREVKPKIRKEYWLAHTSSGNTTRWDTRPDVSYFKVDNGKYYRNYSKLIAITGPHVVEFEEGEGL